MLHLSGDKLHAASHTALVRLAWSLNCAPTRKLAETDGEYRGRLVHAIQRAEKLIARSREEAASRRGA